MNFKQQSFITEYLRHRSAYTAYCRAYHVQDETKYDSIMSAANRLLNDPEVGGVIRSVLEGIRHDVEQEIRAELKTDLLTVQRKREILAKIATGEMYAVQVYKGKDCSQCTQHVWPTINQMLKAIDLDNKMAGLYAAGNYKPQIANVPPAEVVQQVDKLITSMNISIDEPQLSVMPDEQPAHFQDEVYPTTKDNKNSSNIDSADGTHPRAEKDAPDWQQITTILSTISRTKHENTTKRNKISRHLGG